MQIIIAATLVGRLQAAATELRAAQATDQPLPPMTVASRLCACLYAGPQPRRRRTACTNRRSRSTLATGLGYALLAQMLAHEWDYDMSGSNALLDRALAHAKRAVELDENESVCPLSLGYVYLCLALLTLRSITYNGLSR